jgi:hypothetical protein
MLLVLDIPNKTLTLCAKNLPSRVFRCLAARTWPQGRSAAQVEQLGDGRCGKVVKVLGEPECRSANGVSLCVAANTAGGFPCHGKQWKTASDEKIA